MILQSDSTDPHYAPACRWSKPEKLHESGVVVGSDEHQFDLLQYWYSQFRIHNPDVPVAIADFGMTAEKIDWCKQNGHFIAKPEHSATRDQKWYYKPFAILNAPFKRMAWLDIDTEIRGSIAPLFDHTADPSKVAMCFDPFTTQKVCDSPTNSGVIVTAYGNPVISEWARRCMGNCYGYYSDQQVLDSIKSYMKDNFILMPPEFNWLSLMGFNDKALIYHHVGPNGKQTLRYRIHLQRGGKFIIGPN
ncbi:MAG: hypothetical protein FWD53_10180 [Phycisphaerales bacterium]|nr:hypothetical protein [Phycisphaerales bacterium]